MNQTGRVQNHITEGSKPSNQSSKDRWLIFEADSLLCSRCGYHLRIGDGIVLKILNTSKLVLGS